MASLLSKVSTALVSLILIFFLIYDLNEVGIPNGCVGVMFLLTMAVNDILIAGIFLDWEAFMPVWIVFYSLLLAAGSICLTIVKEIPAWIPVASKSVGRALNMDPCHQQSIGIVFSLILYSIVFLNWILPDKAEEEEVLPQYVSSSSQGDSSRTRLTLK
jgi:hypothetical protein